MKPTHDKPTKEELLLVYFKEAEQHQIDESLKNSHFCRELDQLEADMITIEQSHIQNQPKLSDDYGQQLWQQIADKLVVEHPGHSEKPSQWLKWLHKFKNWVLVPQYSLASFAVVLGLVMVAFYAGKQQESFGTNLNLQEQLLAQNIQLHLTQSEIFLTQVSNDNGSYNSQATAQRLLSSNRIFKQALAQHGGQFTNQLLQDLEPILLEYANASFGDELNQAPSYQSHGQPPKVNQVKDSKPNDLMFQIKAMKQQLAQKNDII